MTKIFLDSGNPEDTKEIIGLKKIIDGQTTNPSLVARHPVVAACLDEGKKCSEEMILGYYKEIVKEISRLIPDKSVSIEVYADEKISSEKMIKQGREMNSWIPDAHIKLPITSSGLAAAETLVNEDISVNMTLCFTQEQAAAVHSATKGAKEGQVYISPFIGRLDDDGYDGVSLVENILKMYREKNSHVQVLAASIRTMDHFLSSIKIGSDILTAPKKVIIDWLNEKSTPQEDNYEIRDNDLIKIECKKIDLEKDWKSYEIHHPQTVTGLNKFADDWNKLIDNN